MNLMLRIIDPDNDMLYIGGREIHTIPLQTLRASTGYVMQDNFLFSDTIRNNIAFGDHTKSFEEIQQAAKMAVCKINIDSDIRLAMTAGIRRVLANQPEVFDPRTYLSVGRDEVKKMVKHKIVDVLGSNGKA